MGTKTCASCGRDGNLGGLACPHCATPYPRRPSSVKPVLQFVGGAAFRVVRIGALALGGLVLVFWIYGRMLDSPTKAPSTPSPKSAPTTTQFERELTRGVEMYKRFEQAASQGEVLIGMTSEQALRAWGFPSQVTTTTTARGKSEQWVYGTGPGSRRYVYVDNGIVRTIQTAN